MNQPAAPTAEDSYYAAHRKVYPREVSGTFASLRGGAAWLLLGIFYGLPWLQWQGRQAVLFDLPARQFHLFGLTLWPQDFIFLAWLLVIAALSLFFFTAVAGRLWCGYACPQTVWTEVFLWMERVTEGDRARRMKLDAAPWSAGKLLRKGTKQLLWVVFALWTGFTFVGFFTPVQDLLVRAVGLTLGGWEAFWVVFYGFATYGNAGFLREQVCKYMCPYARFQSAMFDRDTLIITYDAARGEPRGGRRRGTEPRSAGLGDCTDCTLCVQACPTGIDIRNGLQYECIACAACIDACNGVMDRMGYPRGLVRYDTQHAMEHGSTRVLRPRVVVYGMLLALLLAGFVAALALRKPLALDVIHDRNTLYRLLDDGQVENVYLLKIMNKGQASREFAVSLEESTGFRLDPRSPRFTVGAGEVFNAAVRVRRDAWNDQPDHAAAEDAGEVGSADRDEAHAGERAARGDIDELHFILTATDEPGLQARAEARFFGPHQ
jgi:cytochrome c oxidase accessory protein FixG